MALGFKSWEIANLFNWIRKKSEVHQNPLRDLLFGDAPIESGARDDSHADSTEPIASFHQFRSSYARGDVPSAAQALRRILARPNLESRHYLQAWHFLKQLNITPPPDLEKELLGVVVELGMPEGADTLAAYADHSARYLNYSGKIIIWDRPNDSLDPLIEALLSAGREVLKSIGPWDKPRRLPPANGQARINFLTPSGLHFGEGSVALLAKDPRGGPVLTAAMRLMKELIATASSATEP